MTVPDPRPDPDPVELALAQVGDRWTFLVLREAFYGARRFSAMQRQLGIARNLLSQRLESLVAHGVLARVPYAERPPRHEYRLTDKGRDLYTAVVALKDWGERWGGDGPRLRLEHRHDGGEVHAVLRCTTCGQAPPASDVRYALRPAAPPPVDEPDVGGIDRAGDRRHCTDSSRPAVGSADRPVAGSPPDVH